MNEIDIPGPGKFEGNESLEVSEALYGLCGESLFDENFGSVAENGFWEGLFLHTTIRNGEVRAYIVVEDEQGFFSYTEFINDDDARSKYFADLAAYESYASK